MFMNFEFVLPLVLAKILSLYTYNIILHSTFEILLLHDLFLRLTLHRLLSSQIKCLCFCFVVNSIHTMPLASGASKLKKTS